MNHRRALTASITYGTGCLAIALAVTYPESLSSLWGAMRSLTVTTAHMALWAAPVALLVATLSLLVSGWGDNETEDDEL